MKLVFAVAALVAAVSCSSIEFVTVPKSIVLPSTSSSIRSSAIPQLNANLLGLTAQPVYGFSVESDLFSRPRALAVVRIDGVDSITEGDTYAVENDGVDSVSLEQNLAVVFGADRESVKVTKDAISGSALAKTASDQKVSGDMIKTKITALRSELEQIYRLSAAVAAQGAKFAASESADVYQITIQALAGLNLSDEEKLTATNDINNAVQKLASALSAAYGDQAVVEIVSLSSAISPVDADIDEHHIKKRETSSGDPNYDRLMKYRVLYNVSVFTGSDYPAIFAIFLGLIIALVLAVLYTTVGMMSMDPGKDSIIYRMTTTRMKKD